MYPVMLSLRDRPVLVVGGGAVALRKVEGLVEAGARVTVVAPRTSPTLDELARRSVVKLERRPYASGDVVGFALVFVATDDRATNGRIFDEACRAGIWANVADDPDLCTFHLPARVQRGSFQLAIGSEGQAPFVVRRLRQLLESRFGREWSEWMEAARRFREAVRALSVPRADMERLYDRFFATTVDGEHLRARVPSSAEVESLLKSPRGGNGHAPAPAIATEPAGTKGAATPALVSLVGAGPGDPGLLTLRARERLLAADAIVYDRLAAAAIPCELGPKVELHCVGKEAGHHSVPQDETNALLVRLAREGKRTVRLKGGDPFVFGRGSEELLALREAGVPCEVVPGITAGIGVPAYAGIPTTHRGESVRLTLVTAHECDKGDGPQVRWDLLAQDPHVTLVGYMGVSNLPEVVERLIAHGMRADMPAALVARGTTSQQRSVVSTLSGLHEAGCAAGIRPPAIFVIGPTVRFASALDWFTSRPLFGLRLGAYASRSSSLAELELSGAALVQTPRPWTDVARVVLGTTPLGGWLFRSATEVEALEEERGAACFVPETRAICLGAEAAGTARSRGWQNVVELPEGAGADAVAKALLRDGCLVSTAATTTVAP